VAFKLNSVNGASLLEMALLYEHVQIMNIKAISSWQCCQLVIVWVYQNDRCVLARYVPGARELGGQGLRGSNDPPPRKITWGVTQYTDPPDILERNIFWYTPTRNLRHNYIISWN